MPITITVDGTVQYCTVESPRRLMGSHSKQTTKETKGNEFMDTETFLL